MALSIAVVGGGVFGVTAALALRRRGHEVTLHDPGPLPHPLAESTDINKVVRIDYGPDEDYTALGERALEGWRRWNAGWRSPLFHETGVAFLTCAPLAPGGLEHESLRVLGRRGHRVERLDTAEIARRWPAFRPGLFVDGYYNPQGGWAESGAVVARLLAEAAALGVAVRGDTRVARLDELAADRVVVCAGAWAPLLVPALAGSLRAAGQPVFHLRPAEPERFAAGRFPVFTADITRTGWYGFPLNKDGVVKVANHGPGVTVSSDADRVVGAAAEADLRAFLDLALPELRDAPTVERRLCVYCDTPDEHFWIAPDPERPEIVVATGGSGHAFKFAPVLGDLIADTVEGRAHPLAHKFRWRAGQAADPQEATRHHS